MTTPRAADAWVVKRLADGRYLADRFYRMAWAQNLALARTFVSQDTAEKALSEGCEVRMILISEYVT